MGYYKCKIEGCGKTFNNKTLCIEHVVKVHNISKEKAEEYIEKIDSKKPSKRDEGTGNIKVDDKVLDAELRAQIESALKQLLDDQKTLRRQFEELSSLKDRVEELSKRVEVLQSSMQPQPSQSQVMQPQPEVNVLEGEYMPIVRKITMNPKVLMYYQYAKSRGFNGDLADFISEVVEGYFRDRGIKIAVLRGVAEVE